MMMVIVVIIVLRSVMPCYRLFRSEDPELRGRNAGAGNPRGRHVEAVDRQASQGGTQLLERQPGVEEGAEHHVARHAGETIEVEKRGHRNLRRTQSRRVSLKLQYRVSARIT